MSTLRASVSAGESGPVITLSGEADITTAAGLSELITGQLAEAARQLTIDVAGVDFADTAAIRVLLVAARRLRQRGGGLVLLRPQRALARVLEILGANEVVEIRGTAGAAPEPEPTREPEPAGVADARLGFAMFVIVAPGRRGHQVTGAQTALVVGF